MKHYPKTATERFDNAFFHINYCLSFFKKYIKGNILEVGAGCGSFTKNYYNSQIENLILTEKDQKNINDLKKRFKKEKNINILNSSIEEVNEQCDTIIYLHVLEHIRDDIKELENAKKKLANHVDF